MIHFVLIGALGHVLYSLIKEAHSDEKIRNNGSGIGGGDLTGQPRETDPDANGGQSRVIIPEPEPEKIPDANPQPIHEVRSDRPGDDRHSQPEPAEIDSEAERINKE